MDASGSRLGQAQARILGIITGGAPSAATETRRGPAEVVPEVESQPAETEPTAPPVQLPAVQPARSHSLGMAISVGALAGAAMAVLTYFVLSELSPLQDPRVAGIAKRVVGFEQAVEQQGRTLRGTEVDVARLVDQNTAIGQRIDTQAARTEQVAAAVDETRGDVKALTGTSSPIFGVAVLQMGQAIEDGRPFETEWVNLFALTADDPTLRQTLMPLMPASTTGIETTAQLRERLAAIAYEKGLPAGTLVENPVSYGMVTLQTRFGLWLGYTPETLIAADLVAQADRSLSFGEVRRAMTTLERLPAPYAESFAPWMETARRHANARRIVDTLSSTSRERLQGRAQAAAR